MQPSTSKRKRTRGSKKKLEGRHIIIEVAEDGEPLAPAVAKTKLVSQLGYLVRENIPISYAQWKKTKATDNEADIVPRQEKEMCWTQLLEHFTFPQNDIEKVKAWTMMKMAIAFQTFKKNLTKDYLKKGLTPNFEEKFQKQRPHWDAFVQYKQTEISNQKTVRAKTNAGKKQHFHHLGQGGYRTAIPKWEKMEAELIARGIIPATLHWKPRAKHFFFAHGGTLNPENGALITSDQLSVAAERFEQALKAVEDGSFKPDRENDELTYALGNPEHTGRVRGMGVVPWKHGFSGDVETYRSRSRRKAEQEEKYRSLEQRVASNEERMTEEVKRAVAAALSQCQSTSGANVDIGNVDEHRSSVASTGQQVNETAGQRYPVDDITVRSPCELLIQVRQKEKVVAQGIAEVPIDGGTIHGQTIPEGYARVQVDRVESGWEDLDLEIPGGDGETELGHALHTWICWAKRYIRLPQQLPQSERSRPATPPITGPSMDQLFSPAANEPLMDWPSPPDTSEPTPPQDSPVPPLKKKRTSNPSRAPPPPRKKKSPKPRKEKPPPPKLPGEMTPEELQAASDATVAKYFADIREARKPKKKKPLGPEEKKMLKNLSNPLIEKERESDYDRSLRKSLQKRKQGVSTVPQLGEQPNQTVEPLIVQSTQDEEMAEFLLGTTLTKGQIQGTEKILIHEGAQKKNFALGEPLIWPELVSLLPTKMWKLHEW